MQCYKVGYSMGGYGALKLAMKYPDLISSVVADAAALLAIPYEFHALDGMGHNRVPSYNILFDRIMAFHLRRLARPEPTVATRCSSDAGGMRCSAHQVAGLLLF